MKPKEKAKELVDKYKPFVYCYLGSGMLMNWEDKDVILSNAKKCALIAVDELINQYNFGKFDYKILDEDESCYLQEVRQEIEAL